MKRIIAIRFDERTRMLLGELSKKTGNSISVIVRSMVERNIEQWIDKAGNWITDAEKKV